MKREYFISLQEKILIEKRTSKIVLVRHIVCINNSCWPQFLLNSPALQATSDVTSVSFTGNQNTSPHIAPAHYARDVNGAVRALL